MSRPTFALAATALGTLIALGTVAHAENGILIRVQPDGSASADFVALRGCGAAAPVALELGNTMVEMPSSSLHHVVLHEGSGKRHPVEREFPSDIGCPGLPMTVEAAMLTAPLVIALVATGPIETDADRDARRQARAGNCIEEGTTRRCLATADGRVLVSLSRGSVSAPLEGLCTGPASGPTQCRLAGRAPSGLGYVVPVAGGLSEASLGLVLESAGSALERLLGDEGRGRAR